MMILIGQIKAIGSPLIPPSASRPAHPSTYAASPQSKARGPQDASRINHSPGMRSGGRAETRVRHPRFTPRIQAQALTWITRSTSNWLLIFQSQNESYIGPRCLGTEFTVAQPRDEAATRPGDRLLSSRCERASIRSERGGVNRKRN